MDKTPENAPEDPTRPEGEAASPAPDVPDAEPDAAETAVPPASAAPAPLPPEAPGAGPVPPEAPYPGWAPPIPPTQGVPGVGAVPPPPSSPGVPPAKRPSVGAGIGTGFALQFVGVILFIGTLFVIPYPVLMLWPFILITVLAALLLFSTKWRRFATGVLIVAAATWIIVIGPCYGLLVGPSFA